MENKSILILSKQILFSRQETEVREIEGHTQDHTVRDSHPGPESQTPECYPKLVAPRATAVATQPHRGACSTDNSDSSASFQVRHLSGGPWRTWDGTPRQCRQPLLWNGLGHHRHRGSPVSSRYCQRWRLSGNLPADQIFLSTGAFPFPGANTQFYLG